MGDDVYSALCLYRQSDQFRLKSEQVKKNRDVNAGAPLYTSGATPHRVVYRNLVTDINLIKYFFSYLFEFLFNFIHY